MTPEKFRAVREADPFRPFVIHLADGRRFHVRHRHFVSQSPGGRTIVIYGAGEAMSILDLYLITEVEIKDPADSGNQ